MRRGVRSHSDAPMRLGQMRRLRFSVGLLALYATLSLASEPLNISFVGALSAPGMFKDVVVEDEIAYCANYYGLAILDVSDPTEPTLISNTPTPGQTEGIAYQDGYCYITDRHYGLWIYDVSNPREPELESLCELPAGSFRITLDGDFGYVTNLSGSVQVVILSDPAAPERIGELEVDSSWDVKILNNLAYVSNYSSQALHIFDVENPAHPRVVSQLDVDDRMLGITLTDNRLFTSIEDDLGLLGISIADPREPEVFARGSNPSQSLSAVGQYLYGWGDVGRSLVIHDISREDTILRKQTLYWAPLARVREGRGRGACYANGRLFGTGGASGMRIYNFPRPDSAAVIGEFSNPQSPWGCAVGDDYLYVTDRYGAIRTYSLENPEQPQLVDEQIFEAHGNEGNFEFYVVMVHSGLLIVAQYGGPGVDLFSLENPAEPRHLINLHDDLEWSMSLDVAGPYLYEAATGHGIYVVDISDPNDFRIVHINRRYHWGPREGDAPNYGVAVFGDYLLSCHYYRGIATWRRNDDGSLTWLAELQLRDNHDAWRCVVYGDRGYIISRFSPPTITVVDLSNPEDPRIIAQYEDLITDGYHPSPKIVGDYLIVADGSWDGLKIFSLADPDRPQLVGRYDTPIDAWDVAVYGAYAYVADGHDVSVYDVSRAMRAVPEGFFRIELARGWNLISSPLAPEDDEIEALFSPLVERGALRMVKDGRGRFFSPAQGFNNIPGWDVHQGYLVNTTEATSLVMRGDEVRADEPITLTRGWNMAAYFPTPEVNARTAFASLGEDLLIAKDGLGRFYLPAFDFNNMPPLSRGNGYQVKVSADNELVWRVEDEGLAARELRFSSPHYFLAPQPTGNNMSLLLQLPRGIQSGELGIFADGDKCVGAGVIEGAKTGVACWGDNPTTPDIDGALDGEILEFKLWDGISEIPVKVEWSQGVGVFQTDGLAVGQVEVDLSALPTEFALHPLYPNPFNATTIVRYDLPFRSQVKLTVYDLAGREVETLFSGTVEPGRHRMIWNSRSSPAGIYFIHLVSAGKSFTIKALLFK